MSDDQLADVGRRIERLVRAPHEIRDLFGTVARPVLRVLGYKPKIETRALETLLALLSTPDEDLQQAIQAAIAELSANVRSVERASVVHGRAPMAYATWLWKLYQLVRRAEEWRQTPASRRARRPPKTLGRRELLPPLAAHTGGPAVHVLAIDPLMDAAENETELLGRRRRLLEAAREALLDAAAALELDRSAVEQRKSAISSEIVRINRLQAAGVDPELGLTHQVRQALTRGELQRLHAALVAMDEMADARGDGALGLLTGKGLDVLWQGHDRFAAKHRLSSLSSSSMEVFGRESTQAVQAGLDRAASRVETLLASATDSERNRLRVAAQQLASFGAAEVMRAALAVDGCFDVGGPLMPVRIRVEERRLRAVSHPTRELALLPARSIEDVRDAVIEDPRSILLDLAAGRLLARRFIAEEVRTHERTVLRGEARVYVLDGSASMLGPRAAMRDAILVAELATLAARLDDARRTLQPVLYYRYFTKKIGPVRIVKTREQIEAATRDALSVVRMGGTDIQGALLASFQLVRAAREEDPDLARAQIVLVTDGEAPVDQDLLARAREAAGALPIGVSIIALGQENAALRALAARQRAEGERIFYHFVADEELEAIVAGKGSELSIHLPRDVTPALLSAELQNVVDELEQYRRRADADALERARMTRAAFEELQISLDVTDKEGIAARSELLERDWQALGRRFDRWFPAVAEQAVAERDPGADRPDLELLVTLLASLIEVVELTSSDPIQRRSDAIELFERLLTDAGLAPWRIRQLVERHPRELAPLLCALRLLAGMPTDNFSS